MTVRASAFGLVLALAVPLVFAGTAAPLVPPERASAGAAVARVYFLRGEHGAAVHRQVPRRTPATAAVRALLRGPTSLERARGLGSAVPRGTTLLGLTIRGGVATADLSRRFESGGGTASMQARLAQLVYTLTAIDGVDGVALRLVGRSVRVFSSEGLILDRPLTRTSFPQFLR